MQIINKHNGRRPIYTNKTWIKCLSIRLSRYTKISYINNATVLHMFAHFTQTTRMFSFTCDEHPQLGQHVKVHVGSI